VRPSARKRSRGLLVKVEDNRDSPPVGRGTCQYTIVVFRVCLSKLEACVMGCSPARLVWPTVLGIRFTLATTRAAPRPVALRGGFAIVLLYDLLR